MRVGRYGPFLASGEHQRHRCPTSLAPDELTLAEALELLTKAAAGPDARSARIPESGLEVYVKIGRFGPYVQLGDAGGRRQEGQAEDGLAAAGAWTPETVTLERGAGAAGAAARAGRADPARGRARRRRDARGDRRNGRYGPYLKWGTETRSIPAEDHIAQRSTSRGASELFAQPKQGGRGARRSRPRLKELGKHPESERRSCACSTAATAPTSPTARSTRRIPKGEDAAALTLERAVELIDARAAKKGSGRKKGAKKTAKKVVKKTVRKSTKKAAAKKKATGKRAAPKAAPDAG